MIPIVRAVALVLGAAIDLRSCSHGSKMAVTDGMVVRAHRDGSATIHHLPTGAPDGRPHLQKTMPALHVWSVSAEGRIGSLAIHEAGTPPELAESRGFQSRLLRIARRRTVAVRRRPVAGRGHDYIVFRGPGS